MAIRAVVSGKVQGVGFRWFVRQEARRLGVSGWVRNLPDGRVELVAGGPHLQVRRLLEHVRVGPQASQVDSVSEEPTEDHERLPFPFAVLK
jgi:acylphosphatase